MITLYHFTLPQWVAKKGGWEWPGIVPSFRRFTEVVARRVGKKVKLWITLNEPMTIISAAYMSNLFPPAKNDISSIVRPMSLMIKAHAQSYHTIHSLLDARDFKPQVGLAHHLRIFDPYDRNSYLDSFASSKSDEIFNWAIPEALETGHLDFNMPLMVSAHESIPDAAHTQDFFGFNYYSRDLISFNTFDSIKIQRHLAPHSQVQDLGWEIYPHGLELLLNEIHGRYPKLNLWITENGIADASDNKRAQFIKSHLQVAEAAIKKGIPLKGYCHWTLNDNFEWVEGWEAHFGLFSIDKSTLKRTPRASAAVFSDIIHHAYGFN